jgi:hypothetical protein
MRYVGNINHPFRPALDETIKPLRKRKAKAIAKRVSTEVDKVPISEDVNCERSESIWLNSQPVEQTRTPLISSVMAPAQEGNLLDIMKPA